MLSESISDPCGMALRADELWTIRGRNLPVQALSDQFKEVYALPVHEAGAHSSLPGSSSHSSVPEDGSRSGSTGVCWYHRQWGDEACQYREPCIHSGN